MALFDRLVEEIEIDRLLDKELPEADLCLRKAKLDGPRTANTRADDPAGLHERFQFIHQIRSTHSPIRRVDGARS